MRRALLAPIWLVLFACDNHETSPLADGGPPVVVSPSASIAPPPSPSVAASAPRDAAAPPAMPPRPVPKTSPTVSQGMPESVQLQAIQYMLAMEAPRPDDPNADPEFAAQLADQLRPIVMSFDKGSGGEKQKMDRVDVLASGRKIDLRMARGCEAEVPQHVLARVGSAPAALLVHGVLVVRCVDDHTQCLQSTRDPGDVLCTTVPRRH